MSGLPVPPPFVRTASGLPTALGLCSFLAKRQQTVRTGRPSELWDCYKPRPDGDRDPAGPRAATESPCCVDIEIIDTDLRASEDS